MNPGAAAQKQLRLPAPQQPAVFVALVEDQLLPEKAGICIDMACVADVDGETASCRKTGVESRLRLLVEECRIEGVEYQRPSGTQMFPDPLQAASLICVAEKMLKSPVRDDNQGELLPKTEIAHIAADGVRVLAGLREPGELGPQQAEHLPGTLYADDGFAGFRYRDQDAPAAAPQLEDGRTSLLRGEQIELEVAVDPGEVLVVVLRLGTGVFFDGQPILQQVFYHRFFLAKLGGRGIDLPLREVAQ